MTIDDRKTRTITADDPVVKVMQQIHYALFCAAEAFGLPAALEGLANILIINLASAYGEKAAMRILGEIAATATPIAREWSDLAVAAHHEPGHA
jgi:hypothetical protein